MRAGDHRLRPCAEPEPSQPDPHKDDRAASAWSQEPITNGQHLVSAPPRPAAAWVHPQSLLSPLMSWVPSHETIIGRRSGFFANIGTPCSVPA